MIGLDSNIIVRHLTGDDPEQAAAARTLLGSLTATEPGYLTVVGIAEIYWTLRRLYKIDRAAIIAALEQVIGAKEIVVEHQDLVLQALRTTAGGADLGDALITAIGADAGCTRTMTFDRGAVKHAGMRLLT